MEYFLHLKKDKKLASILKEPLPPLQLRQNVAVRLMASLMSQQLSTTVAKVIYRRFLELFNALEPTPQQVLEIPFETLKGIGLSNAKTNYIRNVAEFFIANRITDTTLLQLSNDEIISLLTQIKGVGKWTVEMLLMFTLAREDVFAVDDLGIQQAMMKMYKLSLDDKKAMKEKMVKLSLKWKPYRTYACLHLWNWKDNE